MEEELVLNDATNESVQPLGNWWLQEEKKLEEEKKAIKQFLNRENSNPEKLEAFMRERSMHWTYRHDILRDYLCKLVLKVYRDVEILEIFFNVFGKSRISFVNLLLYGNTSITRFYCETVCPTPPIVHTPHFLGNISYNIFELGRLLDNYENLRNWDVVVELMNGQSFFETRLLLRCAKETLRPILYMKLWWGKLKYFFMGAQQENFWIPFDLINVIIKYTRPMLGDNYFDLGDPGDIEELF